MVGRLCSVLAAFLWAVVAQKVPSPWDYEPDSAFGPDRWGDNYPFCAKEKQSPVAFFRDDVTVDHYIPILRAVNYDVNLRNLKMINSGTSIQIVLPARLLAGPKLNGGKLKGTYRLTKIKFHWGHFANRGSEHALGNRTFPLELQLVHLWGNRTLEQALRMKEGMAIVSVLFDLAEEDNPAFKGITDKLASVRFKENWVQVSNIMPRDLLPTDTSNFFSYEGSLTTPPCSPVVQWVVYTNRAAISSNQLQEFRNVFSKPKSQVANPDANSIDDKIILNSRPVQEVGGRPIFMRRETYEPLPLRYDSGGSQLGASFLFLGAAALLAL